MASVLNLIGRDEALFAQDSTEHKRSIEKRVSESSFLVLGGAGTIGQAVVKAIFSRSPKKLHVVDISENNLVELVRELRSSIGYIDGDFDTFAIDIGSTEYEAFFKADGDYDYVLNLSALKHVRSESNPYTLMRMVQTNIFNTNKSVQLAIDKGVKKYFCVSTDKAANPVNLMGASKRIMELFLTRYSQQIEISMARFANVAFSDGSLLHGFNQRLIKQQPIVAPTDVKRYFVTAGEAGELCLISCLLGKNNEIFFPQNSDKFVLTSFKDIALRFLESRGYEGYECKSEEHAREVISRLPQIKQWPCYFSASDTTGEKPFEEFYTSEEMIDLAKFKQIGIVENQLSFQPLLLDNFEQKINQCLKSKAWTKQQIVDAINQILPCFDYHDLGKYLNSKM